MMINTVRTLLVLGVFILSTTASAFRVLNTTGTDYEFRACTSDSCLFSRVWYATISGGGNKACNWRNCGGSPDKELYFFIRNEANGHGWVCKKMAKANKELKFNGGSIPRGCDWSVGS